MTSVYDELMLLVREAGVTEAKRHHTKRQTDRERERRKTGEVTR